MTDPDVDICKAPDGSLYSLGWYLSWTPGRPEACLDGRFTAQQLRAIADHMDAHKPSPAPVAALPR